MLWRGVLLTSQEAGWARITNHIDHVSDGRTPGSVVLCELTRHFHSVLSPSCVAEGWRSGEQFQVGLDRGCPCLQLASSSSAPRARWYWKEKVLDPLIFGTSCSMTKPAEPSLHEQCQCTRNAEAATQFRGWDGWRGAYIPQKRHLLKVAQLLHQLWIKQNFWTVTICWICIT